MAIAARTSGTVTRIIGERGFGFIRPDNGSEDVFFHFSATPSKSFFDEIQEGDAVQYEVGLDPRSNKACAMYVTLTHRAT